MAALRGIHKGSLPELTPVLENWLNLMEEDWEGEDVPWWYGEQTHVSQFAGAVWQCSEGWAFEEFATGKGRLAHRPTRKKITYHGRGDIAFCVKGQNFMAEAKMFFPSIATQARKNAVWIRARLDAALRAVAQCPSWPKHKKLGMLFLSPCLPLSQKVKCDAQIEGFIDTLQNMAAWTMAWTFPKRTRYPHVDAYLFPGTVVVIRRLQGNRR